MTDPADLGVIEASALLHRRELGAVELAQACLDRIGTRDGNHTFNGDPASVNAWIRVYEEDAFAAAARADERLADGGAPPMCGIPVGLKDLYAVAGKPLTASSRLLVETPERSCDVWLRLEAAGAVLLGHTHTHEFAAGGTTDQVGNPWALDRSSGGSSGGSGAALAACTVPVATGTDTAGSLRIPSALSGVSTIKPTRGHVSLRGIVPLSPGLDHAGPMARSVADCALVLAAMAGPDGGRSTTALLRPAPEQPGSRSLAGVRLAVSPRVGALESDVAEGFDRAIEACRRLGAAIVAPIADVPALDVLDDYMTVLLADMLAYHRRFDGSRDLYRPSIREFIELAETSHAHAEEYVAAEMRRREVTAHWSDRLAAERVTALLEPTVPVTAPLRGSGYDHALSDFDLISLTHYWSWTGFPVVALPSGVGAQTGLPVGVSLVGAPGSDWELLALGAALQDELGVPSPSPRTLS
jgi:aspartyl-tRNA(Asn)/glutamyl-tRNA(Gln) amidotransferase subunit A